MPLALIVCVSLFDEWKPLFSLRVSTFHTIPIAANVLYSSKAKNHNSTNSQLQLFSMSTTLGIDAEFVSRNEPYSQKQPTLNLYTYKVTYYIYSYMKIERVDTQLHNSKRISIENVGDRVSRA